MTDKRAFEAKVDELLHAYGHSIGRYGNNRHERLIEAKTAVLAAYYAGWEGQPNQCDGCVAGTPVRDGLHRDEQGRGYMTCQRERYTHPAPKAVEAAGFVIVRETVVTELSGRPRLGYTLLAPMERGATGVFATGEQAHAFLTAEDRPLGWVVARLDQVLAASPARGGEGEKWLAFDIGCIECGESSNVIGVYPTQELAQKACEEAEKKQADDWHGQHSMEVFLLPAMSREAQ